MLRVWFEFILFIIHEIPLARFDKAVAIHYEATTYETSIFYLGRNRPMLEKVFAVRGEWI